MDAEAVAAGSSCAVARWGSGLGLTLNMSPMFVTLATLHSRGWLKLVAYCQVRRGRRGRG